MKQVKRYKVVRGKTLHELEQAVEKAVWKGYVPQGGVLPYTFDRDDNGNLVEGLAQAVYMSEEEYDYRMESVEKLSDMKSAADGSRGE